MSLITEALKKAQAERADRDVVAAAHWESRPGRGGGRPVWKSPTIVVAVSALLLGLLLVWLTQPPQVPSQGAAVSLPVEPAAQPDAAPAEAATTKPSVPARLATVHDPVRSLATKPERRAVVPERTTEPVPAPVPAAGQAASRQDPPQTGAGRVRPETEPTPVSAADELDIQLRTAETADDYVRLYQMLKARGDEARAVDMVRQGLAGFPDHAVLNRLALISCVRARDYERALVHAEPALREDPDQPALLTYRGLCHFHLRDYPRALADFGRSLALDPNATENIYYLALIYDSQGQYDTAVRYYRMFLDRHPPDRSFRHKNYILDRLGQLTRQEPGR